MNKYFFGSKKNREYFEGWYFKVQSKDGHTLALIPAIHMTNSGEKTASLQVITENNAWWIEYPSSSFYAMQDSFRLNIDDCTFSEKGITVRLEAPDLSLHGNISFGPFHRLKSDIMGPFRFLSNMECVHNVLSMTHSLHGTLILNGTVLNFDHGLGYIESDRGRSFPSAYLWTQSLWDSGSLMLSIAEIPLGKVHFTGCICAIVHNSEEYRIATYRGCRILRWSDNGAEIQQGKYKLKVELIKQKAYPLRAPVSGDMTRTVKESLCAVVRFRLWKKGQLLLDRTDMHAGYEYAQQNKKSH